MCKDKSIEQTLENHLDNVGKSCIDFMSAGLFCFGEILGLAHDLGKFSNAFQIYIRNGGNKVNHSSLGAYYLINLRESLKSFVQNPVFDKEIDVKNKNLSSFESCLLQTSDELNILPKQLINEIRDVVEIAAIATACHHSGLRNLVTDSNVFELDHLNCRMQEDEVLKLSYQQCLESGAETCLKIKNLIFSKSFALEAHKIMQGLKNLTKAEFSQNKCSLPTVENIAKEEKNLKNFYASLFIKYIFSVLIDSDRLDAQNFEEYTARNLSVEKPQVYSFKKLDELLEHTVRSFETGPLSEIRNKIYDACAKAGNNPRGLFKLNVPTGGGKTLSSLKFATTHILANSGANFKKNGLKKVIYVVPYISIIEQNADVVRKLLKQTDMENMLFEFHSNMFNSANASSFGSNFQNTETDANSEVEKNFERYSERWDSQIVFTTMVGFLENVYGGKTTANRRFHHYENSVIIFDEIQSLPLELYGLFNLLVKFLVQNLSCSVVLCSATLPTLGDVAKFLPEKFKIFNLPNAKNIVENLNFNVLKRTNIDCSRLIDKVKNSTEEIAKLVVEKCESEGSVLAIVNTKKVAEKLFKSVTEIIQQKQNLCANSQKNLTFKKIAPSQNVVMFFEQKQNLGQIHSNIQVVEKNESNLAETNFENHAAKTKTENQAAEIIYENDFEEANIDYKVANFAKIFHLSTNMCAAHRLDVICEIKKALAENQRVIVISTQLIEAGVDLDFAVVIRSKCGLDSLIQSAGRCNREGKLMDESGNKKLGEVLLVEIEDENLSALPEIKHRQNALEAVVYQLSQQKFANLNCDEAIEKFYSVLYGQEMGDATIKYKLKGPKGYENETAFNHLAFCNNQRAKNSNVQNYDFSFFQNFGTVHQGFFVINNNTYSVLVPYKDGKIICEKLEASFLKLKQILATEINGQQKNLIIQTENKIKQLLKQAQRYTVNVYQTNNQFKQLLDGVWLLKTNYDNKLGITDELKSEDMDGLLMC